MSVQNLHVSASRESASITRVIRAAATRVRCILAVRYGSRGLLIATLCALVYVALAKFRVIPFASDRIALGMVASGLVIGVVIALCWRVTDLQAARMTERRADLKERLSSAMEFLSIGHRPDEPFFGEQLEDAERHAREVDVAALFKFRLPRELPIALVLLLALAGIFYLPAIRMLNSPRHKQEMAEVKRKGLEIIKLAKDAQKTADQQKLDETRKAAMEVKKLGEAMAHNKLTKRQSLVALAKLTQKMEQTQKRLAADMPKKSLEQAQKDFKRSLDQMQKKIEEAQNKRNQEDAKHNGAKMDPKSLQKMEQAKANEQQSPAMKQVMQAMQQMQQAMANHDAGQMRKAMQKLAQQMQSGGLSKADMKQMQQALQQLGQAMKDTSMNKAGQQLSDMAQMMANMSNTSPSDMQQMAAMMQQAAKQMSEGAGDMTAMLDAKALADLEEAMKSGRLGIPGGGGPGNGGKGPGRGYGATGGLSKAMKEMLNSKARLVAMGKNQTISASGKGGSAKEFAKYLSMKTAPSKYTPNGKVAGTRSQNGNELQMSMTGDPDATRSTSPYYQVYQTSKRQAENSLDKEAIPATYKKQVRDYFESIRP